jgi:hypothetical protein
MHTHSPPPIYIVLHNGIILCTEKSSIRIKKKTSLVVIPGLEIETWGTQEVVPCYKTCVSSSFFRNQLVA